MCFYSMIWVKGYNRICSMLEDRGPLQQKVKYQRITQMEERLNQIFESQNISIKNIRLSSHSSRENIAYQQETPNFAKNGKKVMFQSTQPRTSVKKEAIKIQGLSIKTRKNLKAPNMKTFKSLNSSFINFNKAQSKKSNRSILTVNSQLVECKRIVSETLQKISLFLSTQITQKQIIEWLQLYCEKQRNILYKLFFKVRKMSTHKNKKAPKHIVALQLDEDVLHARLQLKLKDGTNGLRFVSSSQLAQLSEYLQHSFEQKMSIKTKQFEESICSKLRTICEKIRKQQDNQYILNIRKKPVEICDFLVDVAHLENNFGQLKNIKSLNRMKFKILNDTDLVINKQTRQINQNYQSQKQSITFLE